MEQVLHISG